MTLTQLPRARVRRADPHAGAQEEEGRGEEGQGATTQRALEILDELDRQDAGGILRSGPPGTGIGLRERLAREKMHFHEAALLLRQFFEGVLWNAFAVDRDRAVEADRLLDLANARLCPLEPPLRSASKKRKTIQDPHWGAAAFGGDVLRLSFNQNLLRPRGELPDWWEADFWCSSLEASDADACTQRKRGPKPVGDKGTGAKRQRRRGGAEGMWLPAGLQRLLARALRRILRRDRHDGQGRLGGVADGASGTDWQGDRWSAWVSTRRRVASGFGD
ncbi:unnamed protein product [Ostreobium quekettii]|uniref:Uncharacterized protein n=1 Tax=Ostreobium quekettii TaxID=121088 RepID=A0A8S1JDG0_9CHLO|nr:unnamed protein product [Ostreobium quekettii]|eukprot:evm.model.scf_39.18 EVM.evm.TU.scf_39.18   scf_39:171374-172711(-)